LSGPSSLSFELEDAGLRNVLRPLSVRERIRELNLNAVAFADTLMVLHGKKPIHYGSRSLQCSPFHSPTRILSPADIHNMFLPNENGDEENRTQENENCSGRATPKMNRWGSKKSLSGRRSMSGSVVSLVEGQQEEASARAETLLHEREAELTKRLQGFQSSRPRELTPYETKSLVALLHCKDQCKIVRTLIAISSFAAFTRNQDMLREAGVFVRFPSLLAGSNREVQLATVKAAANLALNTGNMKEMEQTALLMVVLTEEVIRTGDEPLLFELLISLTNLSVLNDWHTHLTPIVGSLLDLWSSNTASPHLQLQATRLLINLSCGDSCIPHILSSPCPSISDSLNSSATADQLLRSITLLSNLAMAAQRKGLDRAVASGTGQETLVSNIFRVERKKLVERSGDLVRNSDSDIKAQARKLLVVLKGLPDTLQ